MLSKRENTTLLKKHNMYSHERTTTMFHEREAQLCFPKKGKNHSPCFHEPKINKHNLCFQKSDKVQPCFRVPFSPPVFGVISDHFLSVFNCFCFSVFAITLFCFCFFISAFSWKKSLSKCNYMILVSKISTKEMHENTMGRAN